MNAGFHPFSQIYASQGPLLLDYFYPFYSAFGRDMLAARLAVTAASIGCLAAVYLVGRLLRDPLAGLAALGLLAISPAMIDISRSALAEVPSLGPACLALWLAVLANPRRPYLLYLSAALFAFGLLLKPMVATTAVPILLALAPSWRRPLGRQQFDWALAAPHGDLAGHPGNRSRPALGTVRHLPPGRHRPRRARRRCLEPGYQLATDSKGTPRRRRAGHPGAGRAARAVALFTALRGRRRRLAADNLLHAPGLLPAGRKHVAYILPVTGFAPAAV